MAKSAFTEVFLPVKPQRCTTEPVRPLDGINKDVDCAKRPPLSILWIVPVSVPY